MRRAVSGFIAGSILLGSANAAMHLQANQTTLENRVDALFDAYTKPGSPGCALGVIREGETVYMRGYGLANLEHEIAIDPQRTVFDIGSTSKQFTAAAILLLVKDGKLSMDDDLRTILPEIPDYGQKITLRDLLHQTSGLRDFTVLMTMGTGIREVDYRSADDALALIIRQRALNFAPGSHFMYSNTNYFLLARIVERISGKSFAQFAQERIFAPLGMDQTRIADHFDAVVPHLATAYKTTPERGSSVFMTNWEFVGSSSVLSTVADLAKWDRNFYQPVVGGKWMVDQLQSKGKRNDGTELDYAAGLFVNRFGGQNVVFHGGNTAGYSAEFFRVPQKRFSVIVLCNNTNPETPDLSRKVTHLYLGEQLDFTPRKTAISTTPAMPVTHAASDRFVGTYVERFNQNIRRIEEKDGKFWYVRSERSRSEISALGINLFQFNDSSTQLRFADDGQRMQFVTEVGEPGEFVKVSPVIANRDKFADFTGTYVSDEIGTTWKIVVKDGALFTQPERSPESQMVPLFADAFRADTELLRFVRNDTGQITGFIPDNVRVIGVKFRKIMN